MTGFHQAPPELADPFEHDAPLRAHLARVLPTDARATVESDLRTMAAHACRLYPQSLAERTLEPVHTAWDAWGHRIDEITLTPLWREAARLAAVHGLVAAGHDPSLGAHARLHQFAMAYVLGPSLDLFTCPLAMTDGAATTLAGFSGAVVAETRARLLSRDPEAAWTSGQWMTERTGGSDVGGTETIARAAPDGTWRLWGTKWFTSATTAEVALALARPEGGPPGSRGLALFLVQPRDSAGRLRGVTVNRLKDKLGTRKVPTAELTLDGAVAHLLGEPHGGVRAIAPMLTITRTWNAVCATGLARRAVSLARDYASRRRAFGQRLLDLPLHARTLADLEAEVARMFALTFRTVELLGAAEHGDTDAAARLRVTTPLAKLATGKQAVAVVSEAIECCGGAGYVEDTGLPRLLADAHVLPIWEGTTNVLALDLRRVLATPDGAAAMRAELADARDRAADRAAAEVAVATAERALSTLTAEADARQLAFALAAALTTP